MNKNKINNNNNNNNIKMLRKVPKIDYQREEFYVIIFF